MEFHPVANIFPMMTDEDYEALKADIRQYGLKNPIWIYEDQVLDGRNRWRACNELGIQPNYHRFYPGKASPVDFVVSMNLHRRHLTTGQRSAIAQELATATHGGNHAKEGIPSLEETAELMGVSRDSAVKARLVANEAPDLYQALKNGEVTLHEAEEQVKELQQEKRREEREARILERIPADIRPDSVAELHEEVSNAPEVQTIKRIRKWLNEFHKVAKIFEAGGVMGKPSEAVAEFTPHEDEWFLGMIDEFSIDLQEWRDAIYKKRPELRKAKGGLSRVS